MTIHDEPAEASADSAASCLLGQPRLDADTARDLLTRAWGIDGEVSALNSERDQNWAVTVDGRRTAVLKVANTSEPRQLIELQLAMMRRLAGAGLPVPSHVPTITGEPWTEHAQHVAWMIRFCPGTPLVEITRPSPGLFTDLGRVLGRATRSLAGFDHPAAHRSLYDTAGRPYLVRGRGLFLGVEIVTDADSRTPQPALARRIALELRHAGILISTDGPDNNVLKIKPPMPFGRDDADALVTAIRRSVRSRGTGA